MRQYTWDEYYEKFYDWAESLGWFGTMIAVITGLGLAYRRRQRRNKR